MSRWYPQQPRHAFPWLHSFRSSFAAQGNCADPEDAVAATGEGACGFRRQQSSACPLLVQSRRAGREDGGQLLGAVGAPQLRGATRLGVLVFSAVQCAY